MSALVSITEPQVFAEKMAQIAEEYADDREEMHVRADALMCELLEKLGYSEGVDTFEGMNKWYS